MTTKKILISSVKEMTLPPLTDLYITPSYRGRAELDGGVFHEEVIHPELFISKMKYDEDDETYQLILKKGGPHALKEFLRLNQEVEETEYYFKKEAKEVLKPILDELRRCRFEKNNYKKRLGQKLRELEDVYKKLDLAKETIKIDDKHRKKLVGTIEDLKGASFWRRFLWLFTGIKKK